MPAILQNRGDGCNTGVLGAFNIVAVRLIQYWPIMFLVGMMVNIMAVSVYMGVKMSKGQ